MVIAVGIALVIVVYATLFVVCILFIRKYDHHFIALFLHILRFSSTYSPSQNLHCEPVSAKLTHTTRSDAFQCQMTDFSFS